MQTIFFNLKVILTLKMEDIINSALFLSIVSFWSLSGLML